MFSTKQNLCDSSLLMYEVKIERVELQTQRGIFASAWFAVENPCNRQLISAAAGAFSTITVFTATMGPQIMSSWSILVERMMSERFRVPRADRNKQALLGFIINQTTSGRRKTNICMKNIYHLRNGWW